MKKFIVIAASLLAFSCSTPKGDLPEVSSGKVVRLENFNSKFVDSRNVDIWLPDGYSSQKKYAVVYMHDGQMLFDSTKTWNRQEWKVDEVASELIANFKITECIVVGIWNNGDYRHSEYFPQAIVKSIPQTCREEIIDYALKSKPQANSYLQFIVDELKPFIDKNYSTTPDRNNTFLMGSSMGGIISIYGLCEYPEIFGGAACLSTHWPLFKPEDTLISNSLAKLYQNYLFEKLPIAGNHKIYFDYGTQTLDSFYKPYQQQVDMLMVEKGYDTNNWLTLEFEGEEHSERSWSKRLGIPLKFLLKK